VVAQKNPSNEKRLIIVRKTLNMKQKNPELQGEAKEEQEEKRYVLDARQTQLERSIVKHIFRFHTTILSLTTPTRRPSRNVRRLKTTQMTRTKKWTLLMRMSPKRKRRKILMMNDDNVIITVLQTMTCVLSGNHFLKKSILHDYLQTELKFKSMFQVSVRENDVPTKLNPASSSFLLLLFL